MPATVKLVLGGLVLVGAAACGGSSSGGNGDTGGSGNTDDGGAVSAPVQHPASLKGEVGKNDAYEIELTDDKGKQITNLAAGTYKLEVEDYSSIHNFHLGGAGANAATTVAQTTTKTFNVTFKKGHYTFQCDAHSSQMNGSFDVS